MGERRHKENLDETAKNAFAGYAVVVLGILCFILLLVIIAAAVRLVVGASTGVVA